MRPDSWVVLPRVLEHDAVPDLKDRRRWMWSTWSSEVLQLAIVPGKRTIPAHNIMLVYFATFIVDQEQTV
jgi:hypothetical protein